MQSKIKVPLIKIYFLYFEIDVFATYSKDLVTRSSKLCIFAYITKEKQILEKQNTCIID